MTKTLSEFISECNSVHNFKYNYNHIKNYINLQSIVEIKCPIHGFFKQKAHSHLHGCGCPMCNKFRKKSQEEFIESSKKIHDDKFNYSKVNYIDSTTYVNIICNTCGCEFKQSPNSHLRGNGCPMCNPSHKMNTIEFIERSVNTHGNFYNYSKVNYINSKTDVEIICPIHGSFFQNPISHINGCGCRKCKQSKLEKEINMFLENNNIEYVFNKSNFDWLLYKGKMLLDFYLPSFNIIIECQGEQHFTNIPFFKTINFSERLKMDSLKYQLCKEHGIEIIYYFPEEFLKYDIDFYKDKKCFHNIEYLRKFLDNYKNSTCLT